MQRGVDETDRGRGTTRQSGGFVHKGVDQAGRREGKFGRPRIAGNIDRGGGLDERLDVAIVGGHNLRTLVRATEVHLVSVVARRIVTRGHHHRSTQVQFPQGGGDNRRGYDVVEQGDVQAEPGEDFGGIASEHIGIHASVIADDDARPFLARQQKLCEAVGRLCDENSVHAIGPGAEFTTKSRGAEGQTLSETVGQLREGIRITRFHPSDEFLKFATRLGVRIVEEPGVGVRHQLVVRHDLFLHELGDDLGE